MAQLFIISDRVVFPNEETLLMSPFKDIWERDKTPEKEIALQELTYIEFMASVRKTNPYKGYLEDRKHELLMRDIIKSKDWIPDELVLRGIAEVKRFQTEASSTYSYYMAVKRSVEEMQTFLNGIDLSERTKMGAPVYKPKELTSALIDTEKVLANLKSLEVKVEEELFEDTKHRANKSIGHFAQIESFNK